MGADRAPVYFADLKASAERSLGDRIGSILDRLPLSAVVGTGDIVAIKLHFGELGNTGFVPPHQVRHVVDAIRKLGGRPFVTDANTLYVGSRSDSVAHLETAHRHGFTFETLGCPVIIADGLRGGSYVELPVDGIHAKTVRLAHELVKADAIFCVSHFKGHELSGFGGALKNLGMGGGCRGAKLSMHSAVKPRFSARRCIGCGRCVSNCPSRAIRLEARESEVRASRKVARVDVAACVGCGSCIVVCPKQAVSIAWNAGAQEMQERMVEHLAALVRQKAGRVGYLSFVDKVSPACDCYPYSDRPIVPDIGVLGSLDPVALDAACNELVRRSAGLHNSALSSAFAEGEDKFKDLYPDVDWSVQLDHAEALGVGTRAFDLIEIP